MSDDIKSPSNVCFTYRERVQHSSVRGDVGDGVDGGEVVNKLAAKLDVQGRDGTY